MRKSLRASVLLLALCCPVIAGTMPCPPVAPPPPQAAEEATTDGDMHFPLTEFVLTLLTLF